ncbi:sugar phosphate isomerase/epimerase [Streptomyces sp. NPDC042638]|uniref:sugar phosphate isomerase/epimerase family protein n=1 Tax=Streptomyces sp. NPDC042638 TaxID=3154333 RepID=UPI0033DB3276
MSAQGAAGTDGRERIAPSGAGLVGQVFEGNVADYADRPGELLSLLEETGLTLVGVYTGANFVYPDVLPDELAKVTRTAELAARFGAERLVVGGGARRAAGTREEDYDRLGAALDKVVEIAEAHGLDSSYHPHLGTIAESPAEVEKVMARTRIGFCPDTAHLAAGGGDPAELIRRYPDRLAHVHLKDIDLTTGEFLPLCRGSLDFKSVLDAVREAGYDSWAIVELDAYDGDPKDAALVSRAYLDRLLG